jgi:hypothetical protein
VPFLRVLVRFANRDAGRKCPVQQAGRESQRAIHALSHPDPTSGLYILRVLRIYAAIDSAMRQFLLILSVLGVGLFGARSQSLNIATWMVELPEANPTNRAAEYEPVLKRIAGVLKPLNADILLLHGIPDRSTAKQLTGMLRPRVYHNPVVSLFRKNAQSSQLVEPPLTVLSKKQPSSSRSMEWRTAGQIDSPGGFSFAVFPYGSNVLFLYTAQFPKVITGMTPQQEASIPRKRELSARYLLSHLTWLTEATTNAAKFVYLASDLELDGATLTNDAALAVLLASGFKPSTGNRTLVASAALSSTGWPPDGALTSAFLRGADFPGDPQSIERKTFFAPVALVEVDLKLPQPLLVTAPVATNDIAGAVAVAGLATQGWWHRPGLLVAGMGAGALLLGILLLGLLRRRRRPVGSGLIPIGATPVAGRLAAPDPLRGTSSVPIHVLAGPERLEQGSHDHFRDPDDPDGRGPGAQGSTPKGTPWPFLHLVRERLVRWLAADRSQLLSSHHAGAEQVLELEERLTKIQTQFESRLRAREERIIELEAELMAKEKLVADLEQSLATQLPRKSSPAPS